jgi:hypothetical protein
MLVLIRVRRLCAAAGSRALVLGQLEGCCRSAHHWPHRGAAGRQVQQAVGHDLQTSHGPMAEAAGLGGISTSERYRALPCRNLAAISAWRLSMRCRAR